MLLTPYLQIIIHTSSIIACFIHFDFFFYDKFKHYVSEF
jgi:hypothetical protein